MRARDKDMPLEMKDKMWQKGSWAIGQLCGKQDLEAGNLSIRQRFPNSMKGKAWFCQCIY